MIKKIQYKLILCVILFWCNFSFASDEFVINDLCSVHIKSISKVKTSSNTFLPQTGWKPVQLPDNWNKDWKHYNGGAWYKIDWVWSCKNNINLNEPIAFSIDYINTAGAVFFNGDLLWSDNHLQEPLSKSWNLPRFWILTSAGLNEGHNEFLIYVRGYAFQKSGVGNIDFKDANTMYDAVNQKIWDRRTIFQMNMILSATLGVICFIIWAFRPAETTFGWFALSSMLWVCFILNILTTETLPFLTSIQEAKLNLVFFILYVVCFSLYILRFIRKKFLYFEYVMWGITLFSLFAIFIVNLTYIELCFSIIFFSYITYLLCVYLYATYTAIISRKSDYIFLAVCLSCIVLVVGFDIYNLVIKSNSEFKPWSPYTSPLITLFVVLILGLRLNRNIKTIERFNQDLEERVEEVSTELKNSLNDRHQLELSNVRLQERMKLSHDLHDGLGSSLVRSMILVGQSDKEIGNQQFLSMLKLLRDDLRQIVDSSSLAQNKVPDTPILWLAPVRHRFSQIMEEVDILPKWSIPQTWEMQPTAIQCLNLFRFIEESLTNIVKHSHAKNVKVVLAFVSVNELCLSVEDDGIGFDVDCVTQNGMSIGLKSMKARVERCGGHFKISSSRGKTLLQATIKSMAEY